MLLVNKNVLFKKEQIEVKKGLLIPIMENKDSRFISVNRERAEELKAAIAEDGEPFVIEIPEEELGFDVKPDDHEEVLKAVLDNKIKELEAAQKEIEELKKQLEKDKKANKKEDNSDK